MEETFNLPLLEDDLAYLDSLAIGEAVAPEVADLNDVRAFFTACLSTPRRKKMSPDPFGRHGAVYEWYMGCYHMI